MKFSSSKFLALIACAHLLLTPFLYMDEISQTFQLRVFNATHGHPEISNLLLYITGGLFLAITSSLTAKLEKNALKVPIFAGASIFTVGLLGSLLEPSGGFWLLILAGAKLLRDNYTAGQSTTNRCK